MGSERLTGSTLCLVSANDVLFTLHPFHMCKGMGRTIRRMRTRRNGEVVSDDQGEEEDKRKSRRTVQGGIWEGGSLGSVELEFLQHLHIISLREQCTR